MKIRCINDIPRRCSLNIALDEVFLSKELFEDTFRFYGWTKPAYTIGYFQKFSELTSSSVFQSVNFSDVSVVRRITGGLAVYHNKDLSYSLTVSDKIWNYIYNQEKTYKIIHDNIRKSLKKINIFCDWTEPVSKTFEQNKNFSCVQTLYKDDLLLNGKKIVGSCQRRRGKKILVEGSIHLNLSEEEIKIFTREFFNNLSKELNCGITENSLTPAEISAAEVLCKQKYDNDKWNKLF